MFPFLGILNNERVDLHLAKSVCQFSLVLINKGVGHRSAEVALKKGFKEANTLRSFLIYEFLLQYLHQVVINNFRSGKSAKEINWGFFQ